MVAANTVVPAAQKLEDPRPIVWSEFWDLDRYENPIRKVRFRYYTATGATRTYTLRVDWDDDELDLEHCSTGGTYRPSVDDLDLLKAELRAQHKGEAVTCFVEEVSDVQCTHEVVETRPATVMGTTDEVQHVCTRCRAHLKAVSL